jgi:hypothetical protein
VAANGDCRIVDDWVQFGRADEAVEKTTERTVNRNFTWKEWKRYLPESPYRRTTWRLPWPIDLSPAECARAEEAEQESVKRKNPL